MSRETVSQTNNPNRFSHFPFKGQKRNFSGVSNLAESCHKSNWEANLVQIVCTQAINFKSPLPLPLKAVSCRLAFVLLLLGDCVCINSNIFSKSYPHTDFWKLSVCGCTSPLKEKTGCRAYWGPHWGKSFNSLGKETWPRAPAETAQTECSDTTVLPAKNPFSQWVNQIDPYSRKSAREHQRARRMCWSQTHLCSREDDGHLPWFSLTQETPLCNEEGKRVGNNMPICMIISLNICNTLPISF